MTPVVLFLLLPFERLILPIKLAKEMPLGAEVLSPWGTVVRTFLPISCSDGVNATQPTRQLLITLSNSEMNQPTTQLQRASTIPIRVHE